MGHPAYVWNLGIPAETTCVALTYEEAFAVAEEMGWTKTDSWLKGGNSGTPGYSTTAPSKRLCDLLEQYQMDSAKWWDKIARSK